MKAATALLSLVHLTSAHYTFRTVEFDGQPTSEWGIIRKTANFETAGPIEDVTSEQLTCYELSPGSHGAGVLNVQAGAAVSFTSSPAIFHPGPSLAYLAKVPAGTSVSDWDGKGAVWFKIWQDEAIITSSGISWPSLRTVIMKAATALLSLAHLASAHYTFRTVEFDGQPTSEWGIIRKTANFETAGPIENVTSEQLTCYELNPGSHGAGVLDVQAGAAVSFTSSPAIFHPGPSLAYLAKVPAGTSVSDWDGKGTVWFKIWQDEAIITSSGISWPSLLPRQRRIPLRVEHIGLHTTLEPQFYLSCAQINVSGGSGSYAPAGLLSFPGAYSMNDSGLEANLYWPIPTEYM
ncbi:Cellulose-growth-specific protein like [Verticillium longisporum]|nr:Cellulose-growth-specific protein like [Verticillium longisporum]